MSMFLKDEGYEVTVVSGGDEAVALVRQDVHQFSIALIDYHMPELSGHETIKQIKEYNSDLITYAFSGDDSEDAYQKSLDSGAAFFIQKDTSPVKLSGLLQRTCREIEAKTKIVEEVLPSDNRKIIETINMVGESSHLAEIAKLVQKYAPYNETVLVRGENGTGKEKIARAIHTHSARSKSPLIAINCAAITESLFESELFGYEKGAFTGANKSKVGLFEAAQGGTIFLDEIGDLPKHIQPKLLRVLQEKEITPVGSTKTISVDFRLIAATNAPLEKMIQENMFREDLYYRLNILPINLKPLRDRPEDISALVLHFLKQENLDNNQNKKILKSSIEKLQKLKWPGNVRELQAAIKKLVTESSEQIIDIDQFIKTTSLKSSSFDQYIGFKKLQPKEEKKLIQRALTEGGSVSAASRILSMSRSTFRDRMKKHKIVFEKLNLEGCEV